MSNIDERIVEMKFENHLFEKNVHTSIGSLEKLKAALKFDGVDKSLDNVQKSVSAMDFSRMADGIDNLNKRFSAFGIAGMTVIQDLTRAAEGMLKKVYDNTLGQIKTGGWSRATNVDQAKFLIEGLGHTWEEVSDSIDYAVKSTAYGMDEAAKAAAQFLASGVKAGDQMNYSLRAISGVAAMTNSSYSEIAHIFTTISGQGKVTAEQLNQLASRGLNAAAELAKQMNVTEEEVRKMVTKGEVSFDKFAKAMDDAYGEHAKEANKTFEGSMANMKAALSRIGEKIFAPIRKEAVPIFNALREGIDNIKNALVDSGVFDKFAHFLETVSKFSVNIIGKLFGNVSWITELGKGIGGAIETLDNGIAKVGGFFKGVSEAADKASKKIESAALTIERVDEFANQVIRGDFGNGEARFKALDELTGIEGSWKTIQNRVNELLGCAFRYDDAIEAVKGSTDDLRVTAEYTGKSLRDQVGLQENAKLALEDLGKAIHDSVGEAEQLSIFEWAASVIAGFKAVSSTAGNLFSSIVKGMTGPLIGIGKTVATAFGNATSTMAGWFTSFGQWMLDVNAYEKIQNGVNIVFTKFQNILSGVADAGGKVFTALGGVFKKIGSGVSTGIGKVQEFFSAFTETEGFLKAKAFFSDLGTQILTIKDIIVNGIVDTFNSFANTDFKLPEIDMGSLVASASEKLSILIDKINTVKEKIVSFFTAKFSDEGSIFGRIANFFSNLDWSGVLNSLLSKLQSVGSAIGDVFGIAGDIVLSVWDTIKDSFGRIVDTITSFKESIDFGDIFDTISSKSEGLVEKIVTIKDKIVGTFGNDAIKDSPLFSEDSRGKIAKLGTVILGVAAAVGKVVSFFYGRKAGKISGVGGGIAAAIISLVAPIVAPKILEALPKIAESIVSVIELIVPAISGFVSKAVPRLIEGLGHVIKFVTDAAAAIVPIVMEIIDIAVPMLLKAVEAVFNGVREFLSVISSAFTGKETKKAGNFLSKFIHGIGDIFLFLVTDVFPIVGNAVAVIVKTLGKLIAGVAKFVVKDPIGEIIKMLTAVSAYKAVTGIINLFSGLGGFFKNIGKAAIEWSKATKRVSKATARELNARAILEIALAVGALAASFYAIGQLDDSQFKKAIAGIVVLGGVLAGLIAVFGHFFGGKGASTTAMNPLQTLQEAIANFGTQVSKSLNKIGIAGILIGFAVAITTVIEAIKKIADLPIGTLIKGGIGVAAIIAALVGAIVLMSKYGADIKMGHAGTIFAMAIAIKLIAGAISEIGSMNDTDYVKGIGGVAAIFTGLVGVTLVMSKMKDVKAKPIVAMIGMIVAIAGSLFALSLIKPARLKAASNSILKVMLAMAVLTAAINSLSKIKTGETKNMWQAFAVITALFAEVAAVLAVGALALPEDAVKKLPDIADALSEMMIGLGLLAAGFGIFHKYSGGNDWGKGDWILAILAGVVAIVAGIAGWADELGIIDIDSLVEKIDRGSELMKSLGGAVGSLVNGFVTGFLGFDFGEAVKEAVDDVKNLPENLLTWLEKFDPLLDKLDAINSEHDYGDETTTTITRVTGFVESIAENIADAAGHIKEIKDSGATPEDLTNILGGWATAVSDLATTVGGKEFNGEKASEQFGYIESIVERISNISGIINGTGENGNAIGNSELTNMLSASGVAIKFAEDMKTYGEKIKDVDQEAVTATANAVSIITTLGRDAAQVGQDSILGQAMDGSLIGNGSIDYFADQLQPFAEGMVKYSEEIKGMVDNTDAVMGTQKAVEVITTLAGQASEIGNAMNIITTSDGFISNIQLFAGSLGDFATGMATYSQNISGMNPFAVVLNKAACDMIIELSKAIPDTDGGLFAFLKGNEIDNFSTNIPKLAEGFVKFAEAAGGFQADDAKKIVDTFKALAETADLIVEYSGSTGKEPIETAVDTLAETISNAFDTLAFEGRVDETDTASLISFGENIGKNLGSGIAKGIKESDGGAEIQSALTTLFSEISLDSEGEGGDTSSAFTPMVEALTSALTDMNTVIIEQGPVMAVNMRMAFSRMASTIMGCRGMLNSAVSSACAGMSAQAQKYASKFAQVGKNMMVGLAAGIRAGESAAINAASSAAAKALKAASDRLEVQSPSKAFMRLGDYSMQGLGLGFTKNAGVAVKAAEDSADYVTKSMNRALSSSMDSTTNELVSQLTAIYQYINDVVNEGTNINPVITPVVDLSQVQNGMYSAGSMLASAGNAFGAGALSYARSNFPGVYSYGSTAQGMTEAATLRALNGVRSDLKDLGNAMSAMDMVLDNGVLVGQMGTGMDRQLGTIQKFKERWA